MSALTDLFTAMANKIRTKTGTQTTYTPSEMVSDGIDDVFDAGVESATTPITPSNASPAPMTSGTGYKPTANGYAISSYDSVTPSSTPESVASGDIVKIGGSGVIVDAIPTPTSITPSNSSPIALTADTPVNPTASGYAIGSYTDVQPRYAYDYDFAIGTIAKNAGAYPAKIVRSRGTIIPTADGTAFSDSGWYKMTSGGYAYQHQMYKGDHSEAARDASSATSHTLTGLAGKKILLLLFQYSESNTIAYNREDGATCDDGSTITKICNLLTSGARAAGTFYEVEVATDACKITTQYNHRLIALGIE